MTTTDHKATIQAVIDQLGLSMTAEIVPTKQPAAEVPHPKLHWLCTLTRGPRRMTANYHEGVGYVQGYQQIRDKSSYIQQRKQAAYRMTCEDGRLYAYDQVLDRYRPIGRQPAPDLVDVLHCLIMDSEVLERSGFDEWANEYGYDLDSRKAEQIYRLCVEQSLRLRALLGQDGLDQLRTAYQDY